MYLNAKDLGTQSSDLKFRIINLRPRESLTTDYEYFKLTGKRFGLMRKDELTKQLMFWDKNTGGWTPIDENQFWYNTPDGKRKSYLQNKYSYQCEFDGEQTLTIWKGTKQVKAKEFNMDLTYSQNLLLKQQTQMYGNKKWFTWKKNGGRWWLFEAGDVPQHLLEQTFQEQQTKIQSQEPVRLETQGIGEPDKPVIDMRARLAELKQAKQETETINIVSLSDKEKELIEMAKTQELDKETFTEFLKESGSVGEERISVIVSQL